MSNAIEVDAGGLKCDAPDCDYRDDTVTLESYPQFVNAPCPKCGANLLTEADFAAVNALLAAAEWFNMIAGPVADDASPGTPVNFEFDGSGVPTIVVPNAEPVE